MANTIADLEIKIGADSSQLSTELKKVEQQVGKSFVTSPLEQFGTSVDGVSGKVANLVGKFAGVAAVAAGGFGLSALVSDAVKVGEAVYQVQQRFNLTAKEAAMFSRTVKMSGNDIEGTAKVITRLDKSLMSGSKEGQKAQKVFEALGVSLKDAQGNLLPINQQLEQLATAYERASKAGKGQEFLISTLGTRGLQLEPLLRQFKELQEDAAKIHSIGLDPEQLHQISREFKVMDAQMGQLKLAAGSALAPLVQEMLPQILPMLQTSADFIKKNKTEIAEVTGTVVKLIAAYEAFKMAKKGVEAINTIRGVLTPKTVDRNAEIAEIETLSKAQERQINKAIADSDRMYAKMRKEAVETAKSQNMSAEETQVFLSETFARIGIQAQESATAIRTAMTNAFVGVAQEAALMAERTAIANQSTVAAAQQSTSAHVVTNEEKIASNEAVIVSAKAVSEANLQTGIAAKESGIAHVTANEEKVVSNEAVVVSDKAVSEANITTGITAKESAMAHIAANTEKIASNEAVAISATEAGNVAVMAAEKTTVATKETTKASILSKGAFKSAGMMAGMAGVMAVNSQIKSQNAILDTIIMLSSLAGGWGLVAAAALTAAKAVAEYWDTTINKKTQSNSIQMGSDGLPHEIMIGDDGKYHYVKKKSAMPSIEDAFQLDPEGSGIVLTPDKVALGNDKELGDVVTDPVILEKANKQFKAIDDVSKEFGTNVDKLSESVQAVLNARGNGQGAMDLSDLTSAFDGIEESGSTKGNSSVGTASGKEDDYYDIRAAATYNAWNNSGKTYGTGEGQVVCTTYVAGNWIGAGDPNGGRLSGWAPDWSSYQGFHATDTNGYGYDAKEGDAVITNDGAHVIQVGPNGRGYFAAAGEGRVSQYYDTDYRDAFAGSIVGVVSLTEHAGVDENGKVANNSAAAARKRAEEHEREIVNARRELKSITDTLNNNIVSNTGTEYEAGLAKIEKSVDEYKNRISKIKNTDRSIKTEEAEKALQAYKKSEIEKLEDKRTKALNAYREQTAKTEAEVYGTYKEYADASYQVKLDSLEKTREEEVKKLAKNKDDLEALYEVEKQYAAKRAELVEKYEEEKRQAYEKTVKLMAKLHKFDDLNKALVNPGYKQNQQYEGLTKQYDTYVKLFNEAFPSQGEQVSNLAETINSDLGSALSGLIDGTESFRDTFESVGKSIVKTITAMVAKMAAAQIVFGALGSFMGNKYSVGSGSTYSYQQGMLSTNSYEVSSGFGVNNLVNSYSRDIFKTIPKFANGGRITAPTIGLIGEGRDEEGIFPLNEDTYGKMAGGIITKLMSVSTGTRFSSKSSAPIININNYSDSKVSVAESGFNEDLGTQVLTFVIEGVSQNKNNSQAVLKQLLGGK